MLITGSNPIFSPTLKPGPKPSVPAQPEPQPLDEFRVDAWKLTKEVNCEALYQTMYNTVQHLSYVGIPGCAGVAIAKAATHSLDQGGGTPEERSQFNWQALGCLRWSFDQTVSSAARDTFERTMEMDSRAQQDQAIGESLRQISRLEGWNISQRLAININKPETNR